MLSSCLVVTVCDVYGPCDRIGPMESFRLQWSQLRWSTDSQVAGADCTTARRLVARSRTSVPMRASSTLGDRRDADSGQEESVRLCLDCEGNDSKPILLPVRTTLSRTHRRDSSSCGHTYMACKEYALHTASVLYSSTEGHAYGKRVFPKVSTHSSPRSRCSHDDTLGKYHTAQGS